MKALIKVGYGCNEHCTFCHTMDVRHIDGADDEITSKIVRARALGHTMVVLSGGEPTIRPELTRWAERIAALGMDLGLITNGMMLAYPKLVDRLTRRRLRYVYMSFHGGTAAIHKRLTRADGFEHTCAAIDNLSGTGVELILNTVVTKHNLDHLIPIVEYVLRYPDVSLKFSMVQPKGGGERFFDALTPRVADVAARVRDAIAYGIKRAGDGGPRFAHDGIPLCLVPGYEDLYDDLKTHDFATMVDVGEPDFFPVDDRAKVQPAPCDDCGARGPCPGLYRGYHERFGHDELVPLTGRPRSNSFNYRFDAMVTDAAGDRCPLLLDQGVTPWDRGRVLLVKAGQRVDRYRATTRDFTDVEIDAIKHGSGQIYLDVADKSAPNDFAADLVQLLRAPMCSDCPERDVCTGMFEVSDDNAFARDDRRVESSIAGLSGDVLDVGCGEGRYHDRIAALAEAGTIRYVGIEPDPERIRAARARWPWAELRQQTVESLGPETARCFDHVLVLRSWNHLRDPRAAAETLRAALRPGGTLTVVDNIAFGLARSSRQAARGEASAAGFEHYRNDGATEADRVLAAADLLPIDRCDVTPATSNQWILRYQRAD